MEATSLADVGKVTEITCPNKDQLACKRFSIHGAYCVSRDERLLLDPEYPTNIQFWEVDSVKRENDKCFRINEDTRSVLLTSDKTMVPYVLSKWLGTTDVAGYENQRMRQQELQEKTHTSPYCNFWIKRDEDSTIEIKRKHKLYTQHKEPIEVQNANKATVKVEFEPSGDDVMCCVSGMCREGTVGARTEFDISTDLGTHSPDVLKLYTKTAADYDWDNFYNSRLIEL